MVNDKKKNNYGRIVARSLIDIEAINLRPDRPYILTSGWASPVYIDCRKVIAHLEERRIIIDLAVKLIKQETDNSMDMIAGGETAGIPYAAWITEALS